VAPGNAGTASIAPNLPVSVTDLESIGNACFSNNINLVVVGPEVPLVEGMVDYFKAKRELSSILIVGPSKQRVILEGSKDFSKAFMQKHDIPTAASRTFTSNTVAEGVEYVSNHPLPVVLKADGLAAGKGVIIAESNEEAVASLKEMLLEKKF